MRWALVLLLFVSPVWADTGLWWQGSAGLADSATVSINEQVRFGFLEANAAGLPIYPVTIIWEAYPEQQTGFYVTFFYCTDDGTPTFGETFNDFWGAHPYPQGTPSASGTTHKWEIAVEGSDIVGGSPLITYDTWYTQAFVAWDGGTNSKWHKFYWNLPDVTGDEVITHEATSAGYGENFPSNPALVFGDAPWGYTTTWFHEAYKGVLRGLRIYNVQLSEADILTESVTPLGSAAGAAGIWYMNMNPTPDDISDKSGNGNDPVWFNASWKPLLWTGGGSVRGCLLSGGSYR